MKVHKLFIYLLIASSFLLITACGGGGGDSTGSGEVAIDITDAKPMLPEGVTNFWITFTDVLVHKPGGGWISLEMAQTPYTIDLLQFSEGETTELVPPVLLESGKYTQIRLVIDEEKGAKIKFANDDDEYDVEIPPNHLKTDKNFTFDPQDPAAADILIDFDLSQSLVVTGPSETPSYKLKPVLHIVSASEAATINGKIAQESFGDENAIVTVFYNNIDPESPTVEDNYEEYTKVVVLNPNSNPTPTSTTTTFSIFWLVPNEGYEPPRGDYRVEIDFDDDDSCDLFEEGIFLDKGDDYPLELAQCN